MAEIDRLIDSAASPSTELFVSWLSPSRRLSWVIPASIAFWIARCLRNRKSDVIGSAPNTL